MESRYERLERIKKERRLDLTHDRVLKAVVKDHKGNNVVFGDALKKMDAAIKSRISQDSSLADTPQKFMSFYEMEHERVFGKEFET